MANFTVEERFNFLENYVQLVTEKKSNSLIISGNSGLGKTYRVIKKLKETNTDYFLVKGFATARALYDTMYRNRNKLIVFDDCDSILEDKVAINLLKGALDSYDERIVSWLSKTKDKSIPLQFDFQGQVIFISNLPLEKFDKAMKSRALTIDVFMTPKEKYELMMKTVYKSDFMPHINQGLKTMVVMELNPYMYKEGLNFRTLEQALIVYNELKPIDWEKATRAVIYIGENA